MMPTPEAIEGIRLARRIETVLNDAGADEAMQMTALIQVIVSILAAQPEETSDDGVAIVQKMIARGIPIYRAAMRAHRRTS